MSFNSESDSYPTYVTDRNTLSQAFPSLLKDDVDQVTQSIKSFRVWSVPIKVQVGNEVLYVRGRVIADHYDISRLSDIQQTIYHCIYSRSTDGYVREASLRSLINGPITNWVAPYLFISLSDYVIQAASVVPIERKIIGILSDFAKQNRELYDLTLARSVSYWDLNYREGIQYDSYQDFPPYKLLRLLDIS
jgi:hypothetical protein